MKFTLHILDSSCILLVNVVLDDARLQIFFSNHYAGPNFGVLLRDGEQWKKVYGPIFVYLNSDAGSGPSSLWQDAKRQVLFYSLTKTKYLISSQFLLNLNLNHK